jgi:hypothetical protein
MKTPPLLAERPLALQVILVGVIPAVYGVITGYFLGVSEGTYLVLSLLAVLGGVGAGFDHSGAGAGAQRGALGGTIFGASVLIAHEIHGATAKADLPHPAILLVVVTALLGALLGALGGYLRARADRDSPAT